MTTFDRNLQLAKRIYRERGIRVDWDELEPLRSGTGDWLACRSPGMLCSFMRDPFIREARQRTSFIDGCHPSRVLPLP